MPLSDNGTSTSDTQFTMPGIDDQPTTETGVILMGFDTERLLACLGAVTPVDDDPTRVILRVDQIRHGVPVDSVLADLVTAGAERWRTAQATLPVTDPPSSAALRSLWTHALKAISHTDLSTLGGAARAYVTACWLRRAEVDRYLERHHVLPAIDP